MAHKTGTASQIVYCRHMNKFKDPCTLTLETDEVLMQIHNPYVANLVEMGYFCRLGT